MSVKGKATIVEAPEGDSRIVFVDVAAMEPDAAIQEAWAAYRPDAKWPLKATTDSSDKDGWTNQKTYSYQTSPNERRGVAAGTLRHGDLHLVWIYDMADPVAEKRGAQVALIFGRLFPKGYSRETFAGRKANSLDDARIKELGAFIEQGLEQLGVPGASLALVQGGKVVFAGGFGVKELGKPEKPDASTLYMIASNTKAMTTMLLGRLVDQKKITWTTPVTTLLPQFKLGDADTTSKVLVEHLICACTGLPRQDFEWLLEFANATPESALATLGTMQPTSKFGEMFQYSNPMAAAAGYVAGHVLFPSMELGAAYDRAMTAEVFGPLGMTSTTFDFARALNGNHAASHALDIDGKPALAAMGVNYSILPVRPAGGAWSSVADLTKYVQMELAKGLLPNGTRYASEAVLKARQEPKVWIGRDDWYGMGLMVDQTYGTPVVHHGGSMIGYKSDMMWLPEHGVARRRAHERRPGRVHLGQLPAQAARSAVRRQARGRQRSRGGGQGDEGADRGRAQAAHGPARPGRGREARVALRERGARRDRRDEGRQGRLRLRRVQERGRVTQEPGRHGFVPHHDSRVRRPRVRRGSGLGEAHARVPRRAARVHVHGEVAGRHSPEDLRSRAEPQGSTSQGRSQASSARRRASSGYTTR